MTFVHHDIEGSHVIKKVSYDAASRLMDVQFLTGAGYRFHEVEVADYEGLIGAPSIGGHFSSHIRDKFPMSKIDDGEGEAPMSDTPESKMDEIGRQRAEIKTALDNPNPADVIDLDCPFDPRLGNVGWYDIGCDKHGRLWAWQDKKLVMIYDPMDAKG